MNFEIDVSGEDLLNENYSICVANKNGSFLGFKFSGKLIRELSLRHRLNLYRYDKNNKSNFKIRLYCIVVYYILKKLNNEPRINLFICRDFFGNDMVIKDNFNYFLKQRMSLSADICFVRLSDNSNAHKYAYLMRKDNKNAIKNYIKLNINDFEEFLRK